MEETLEDIVEQGEALGRPEGEADLGYFLSPGNDQNVKQNAENVCVLVIHYDFKKARNKTIFRDGDAEDVINLQNTFEENRKCNFRSLLSPKREVLLELLSDQEKLLRLFSSKDVPSVFVLYILSHGNRDGEIFTDHYESEDSENFVSFSTADIFDSLKNLTLFEESFKIINFAPCRGDFFDTIYSANHQVKFDNKNSCRITYPPEIRNLVVFYSTVETTRAIRGVSGTAFIREACKVLDSMKNDQPLSNVLTSIQNQIHNNLKDNYNAKEGAIISQTPEVKMFALNRRFFFSKSSLALSCSSSNASKVKVESEFFPWKSNSGVNVRHRRAFLLFSEPNEAVNKIKKALSENLKFEVSERMPCESSLDFSCNEGSDVGCVFTFLFGKLSEREVTREVCCRFGDKDIAMTDILHNFIGPNNDKWIGKPKIFFLIDHEAIQTDAHTSKRISWSKNFGITSTNHSGWLVLVLQNKGKLQLLIEIFKGRELKEGKSLQELIEILLISESKEDRALLNSTLQFKLDFPEFPRSFLKPHFSFKGWPVIDRDADEPFDFDAIVEHALKDNRIWVLRSVAGAGKTTVLREIAFQLGVLNGELKILRISLASISHELMKKRGMDEIEFLAGATHNPVNEVVEKWIESGSCVVFLDGFDEIDSTYQGKILTFIKALKSRSIPVWIGTRPHEAKMIEEAVGDVVSVEIEPLTEEQQIEFLQLETNKSREQCQTFLANFQSKGILQNPLHLSLVAQSGGKSNLHDIYKQVVELKVKMCLKNRVGLNVAHNQFKIQFDSAMELLEKIAFQYIIGFHNNSETKENLEKVYGYGVATFKYDWNDWFFFTHRTFAEFLAAQKIVHDIEDIGKLESGLLYNNNYKQSWQFVDLYYGTVLRKEKTIKVHREAFLEVARLNPDVFLEKVAQEGLRNIFSMLKPFMTYDETKDGHICYSRNLKTLESAVESADEIAAHLIEIDLFESEDQVLESLPILVSTAAKYNAIIFFQKLKEKFPKLPMMIESIDPMYLAVCKGHDEILDFLLQNTVQPEATDGHEILLRESCTFGFIKCVKVLFKHGAREIRDESPLEVSAKFGHLELVKFLLEDKIRERAELKEEWRAYKRAVDRGHTDVAKYLLEMCPNLKSFRIQSAQSPLHLAVVGDCWELCQWIVNEAGADVTTLIPSGESKDWSEVEIKYFDIYMMFQNDVNKKDDRGKTAIHCAAEYGMFELVHKLINSGANVQDKDNSGWNSFHFACKNQRDNSIEVIQLLLSTDNQLVKEKTGSDQTGLHIFLQNCYSSQSNIDEVVYFLIDKAGVDAKAVDKEGRSALCIAMDKYLNCIGYLLKEAIDLDFKNSKGQTHLHLAAEWDEAEAIQIWKSLGGDLNIRDQTDSTAMQVAIEYGSFWSKIKLKELGADVNTTNDDQRDDRGKTALHHTATPAKSKNWFRLAYDDDKQRRKECDLPWNRVKN